MSTEKPPKDPENPMPESLFGIDLEEVESFWDITHREQPNRQICVCGHGVNRHLDLRPGETGCFVSRMSCPCAQVIPVLEVSDTRYFMTKTAGWGDKHALSTGLLRLHKAGGTAKSLIGKVCLKCGVESEKLIPTSMDESLAVLEKPGTRNALLCSDCWAGFRD
jgi:hypothetical protein